MRKFVFMTVCLLVVIAAVWFSGIGRRAVQAEVVSVVESFDSCRNISFIVWNVGPSPVQIKKIKYYNRTEGKWKTEDTRNKICPRNVNCKFGWDNLGSAEGDDLTKIVFVFEDQNTKKDYESREFVPDSPRCVRDKTYGFGQRWEIKAPAPVPEDPSGACKQVTFEFTNGTNKFMKIPSVKFFNRRTGKWKTETIQQNLSSESCPPKMHCTTWDGAVDFVTPIFIINLGRGNQGSNLEGANGEDITKIIFVYKTSIVSDKGFSAPKESKVFEPTSPKCVEKKKFGFEQNWTIGGN